MQTNPSIFKAYDIRGIYKKDLDEKTAYDLGLAYIELRKKDLKNKKQIKKLKIVVSSDMRLSSPSLKKHLINGLLDAGADVIDIGMNATPTFYFAVAKYKYDGGIMVSASHNPKEWNGFKLTREKAIPISGNTGIEFLKEKILNSKLKKANKKGLLTKKKNVLQDQIKHDLKHVKIKKIKPFKIVADPANAVGSLFINELFKYLPVKLIKINFKLDGNFPAHEADPLKEENIKEIKKEVLKQKADLGITTDGDGDRIFFIDNKGELIDQAIIRGLLAKLFLKEKPKSKIGFDVRPGKITEDLILENKGKPVKTRVGHSLIKEQMLKENIYFSGESSGHFFLNMAIGCFEIPNIVILKLLEEFSNKQEDISEQIKKYKKYFHSGEINKEVKNKEKIFKSLEKKYKKGKINKLDGLSVVFNDFWFNVRASNTENKMRLNLEAINKKVMEERKKEIIKIIEN
ncbi:MAG: phosphomannomutase/phosphoglucomutase [Patescibacteria group bacterium]|nr:phosphomannomutase/phosphoglucomutase [Patescibacteria group bacterium]